MTNLFAQSFAKDRTEDDILSQAPITLMLGTKEYPVKPLPIKKSKEWRGKVAEVLNQMSTGALSSGVLNPQTFMQGIMVAFFKFPDQVLELVIAYSPELLECQREVILDSATDEEIVVAFSRIMSVAYPFFNLLGQMKSAAMATDQARISQA